MFKTKKCKTLVALGCITTMLFPYGTPVLAKTYKHSEFTKDTVITFYNSQFSRKGYTYTFTDNGSEEYTVYHPYINENGEKDTSNIVYCLDAEKIFPGFALDETNNLIEATSDYKYSGSFFDTSIEAIGNYKTKVTEANYKSICWLANNFYVQSEDDEDGTKYEEFLLKVFKPYLDASKQQYGDSATDIDEIKEMVSKDDIDTLQQCAIWYFSNSSDLEFITENTEFNSDYNMYGYVPNYNLSSVSVKYSIPTLEVEAINRVNAPDSEDTPHNMVLSYLISNAKSATTTVAKALPEFVDTELAATIDGENYKVGPFKITGSDVDKSNYNLAVTDGADNALTEYVIKDSEGNVIDSIDKVVAEEGTTTTFYIYVPTTVDISKVKVSIKYNSSLTSASMWEKVEDEAKEYQPLIWITREPKVNQTREVPIEESDLALRKYIVGINGDESVARKPVVDATGLIAEENPTKTAIYKHAKSPLEVKADDKIIYELRVYNEGKTNATVKQIVDYIPEGLEIVSKEESTINSTYNWSVTDNVATIDINKTLNPIDNTAITNNKDTLTGGLDTAFVQIELKVKSGLTAEKVLTNVAEIISDNVRDRDSETGSIVKETIDQSTFAGDRSNKTDLTDSNYYYKGLEDDDDFEKVKIEGKIFDLSLQKFITEVNGKKLDREPKVDVKSLATSTNATYTQTKTPVVAEVGDIVVYTIRVYNEGDMDGFAEEVADYIPEGLGFLVNYKLNNDNLWEIKSAIESGAKTVKLSTIKNGTKNVKLSDFENTESLDDVEVVKGLSKLKTTVLSSNVSSNNKIAAFDSETSTTLNYKDIKVACIVLAEEGTTTNLRNIAEITKDSAIDKDVIIDVDDIDSTPDTVNPNNYPGNDKSQDDHDYENLTIEDYVFDLALQKYITAVGDKKIENRKPTITFVDGKIKYNHESKAQEVGNGDLVEYTITVYNEGTKAGYAAEVADNLPNGLLFVEDNETNKKYNWKLYDKFGNPTKDINQAVTVRTDYLSLEASKARGENCLLEPFDAKNNVLDSQDIKIVFKVVENDLDVTTTTEARTIINIAEITNDTDENGNDIDDEDSTPDNWIETEDDLDKEKVYVKYFDLELQKDLVKVVVIENGTTTEYDVNDDQLFKVELNKKKLATTVVKFVYNITVTNKGEIDGYATEIKDYIPEGLEFSADDNQDWYQVSADTVATTKLANTLLKHDESASVQITLKWINSENNLNKKVNVAEISADKNDYNSPDIDSTPDNRNPNEDDIDDAPVILSLSTGLSEENSYIGLTTAVIAIMATGIILIKKYVL